MPRRTICEVKQREQSKSCQQKKLRNVTCKSRKLPERSRDIDSRAKETNSQKDIDECNTSDVCFKCLDEAKRLLNYSPESVFLRRIKQRIELLQNKCEHKNYSSLPAGIHDNASQDTLKEESDILDGDECQVNKFVKKKDNVGLEKTAGKCIQRNQRDPSCSNMFNKTGDTVLPKVSKRIEKLKVTKQNISLKRSYSQPPLRNCTSSKSNGFHIRKVAVPEKSPKSAAETPSLPDQGLTKCDSKKEVARDVRDGGWCATPTRETAVQTETPFVASTTHDKLQDRNTSSDPCLQHFEKINHFRQNHWFDCYAHPHLADSTDVHRHPRTKDAATPEIVPDLCIRSFRQNRPLHPEMVPEAHGLSCCLRDEGISMSSTLRQPLHPIITLPSLPLQLSDERFNAIKLPPGVCTFPATNLLICDPPPSSPPSSPRRRNIFSRSSRRIYKPTPNNSLALRFQKGVR